MAYYDDEPLTDEDIAERDKALGNEAEIIREAGVFYRTRDGRKAFVRAIRTGSMDAYPCKGHIIERNAQGHPVANQTMMWARSGRANVSTEKPNDLVEPWSSHK